MNNKTIKSMQNFTFMTARGKRLVLILFFALMSLNVFAEGTPTVSPRPANITALMSAPDLLSGPYFNAPEDNRVKFTITNNATQNLYFGFDMMFISKTHIQLYLYSNHRNKANIERNL